MSKATPRRNYRRDSRLLIFWGLVAIILMPSMTLLGQLPNGDTARSASMDENYKIGPGDLLDVIVSKNDTLTRSGLRVTNKGTIQLAMLDGDVQAACLTERQLADLVKEKYKKYLVNPFVNVSVREFNSTPVAVIGAVNSPGRFQLKRQIRLAELLTFVNGPSKNAGNTVEIMRTPNRPFCEDTRFVTPTGGVDELLSVDLTNALKGGDDANPIINAGDIIRVVEANQVNAYIQGNVKTSLAISLSQPVTLVQAVAMAGGPTAGADLQKVKIRRQMRDSINRDEIIINLKDINAGKRDDVLLQANDVIEVPGPSGGKKIFQGIIRGIIPSLTGLPVGVVPY